MRKNKIVKIFSLLFTNMSSNKLLEYIIEHVISASNWTNIFKNPQFAQISLLLFIIISYNNLQ